MIEIPPITIIETSRLKPDPENPNKMTVKQLEGLAESIKRYGFIVPIITNRDYIIADGHQRLQAAETLGMTTVPVIALPLNRVDHKILRQVLNKLRGEHDLELDQAEVQMILDAGHELDYLLLTGQDERDLRSILGMQEPVPESFEVPEIEKIETTIQQGDIYVLGNHRLMCGDSTIREDVEKLMNGEKADMVFTDPPYGVEYEGGTKKRDPFAGDETTQLYDAFLSLLPSFINKKAPLYIWHADCRSLPVLNAMARNRVEPRTQIIWNKNQAQYGSLSAQYKQKHEPCWYAHLQDDSPYWYGPTNETTVWNVSRQNINEYHPTQKPVELAYRAINNSSLPNSIVVDLFGGGGSTLIACEQTGRRCFMMEIEPRYCQIIINRWEQFTGRKAEHAQP